MRVKIGLVFWITSIAISGVSSLLLSSNGYALPIPKTLVEEVKLSSESSSVNFSGIKGQTSSSTNHLIVEVFTSAEGGSSDSVPVNLTFNDGEGGSYMNRTLKGVGDDLSTDITERDSSAVISSLPVRAESRFGYSRSIIPWAFLSSKSKHVLTQSGVGGEYISTVMSHWDSVSPIESIQVSLDGEYRLSAGSVVRLYAVDESHLLNEKVLRDGDAEELSFSRLPQDEGGLIVLGQSRSSEVNPTRKGDRVWYSINSDIDGSNYQVQRLTGEAPFYSQLNLGKNKLLLDQMNEPRVGWNTAAEAPEGVFGPWVVSYPEYASSDFWSSFMSLHGTHDNHYNPVGNEVGVHRDLNAIDRLNFFPQGGEVFEQGSRVGVYSTKDSHARYTVEEGQSEVTLIIPEGVGSAEIQAIARSTDGNLEDDLVVEFNGRSSSYPRQTMWSLNSDSGADSQRSNVIGSIPAGGMNDELFSSLYGSLVGLGDELPATLQMYGGIPGEGRASFSILSDSEQDSVSTLTIKTKSGAEFAEGSVFTVWLDENNSGDYSDGQITSRINGRAVVLMMILILAAVIVVSIQVKSNRSR